jgi:hypothetical protein
MLESVAPEPTLVRQLAFELWAGRCGSFLRGGRPPWGRPTAPSSTAETVARPGPS